MSVCVLVFVIIKGPNHGSPPQSGALCLRGPQNPVCVHVCGVTGIFNFAVFEEKVQPNTKFATAVALFLTRDIVLCAVLDYTNLN